ncbi:MAG: hypothetical protein JWO30_118 [Fibrobacteres bacterium]|nr:hypothetical protein [Fibrobacterota bacterium]
MIDTIEQFLSAFRANSNSRISLDVEEREFHYEDAWGIENLEVDPNLMKNLVNLGILYIYSGVLEVNPMAIRVLERMEAERKPLTEVAFKLEVEESKDLYKWEHHDDQPEMESHST